MADARSEPARARRGGPALHRAAARPRRVGGPRLAREDPGPPICLDETLKSASIARQVVELEGPRVWNIKVHRVGGLTEVCRIYRIAAEYGARLWAGTMPESGIGSQAPLAVAALPLCSYPSDLEPSSRSD